MAWDDYGNWIDDYSGYMPGFGGFGGVDPSEWQPGGEPIDYEPPPMEPFNPGAGSYAPGGNGPSMTPFNPMGTPYGASYNPQGTPYGVNPYPATHYSNGEPIPSYGQNPYGPNGYGNAVPYGTNPNPATYYNNNGQPIDPYGTNPYGPNPYGSSGGANPYSQPQNPNPSGYMPPGLGGGGGTTIINNGTPSSNNNDLYNHLAQSMEAQARASMYGSDKSLQGVLAGIAGRQAEASQQQQTEMARIAMQQQYYQGLLQNQGLDDATRRYIADQANQLGIYQANLQSQYQMGQLGVSQGQLGVSQGQLGLNAASLYGLQIPQMQGQIGLGMYNAGTNLLGTQGNLMLGMGQLGVQAQQMENQNLYNQGNLYLQGQLGMGQLGLGFGNLGIAQQQADTQSAMGLGDLALRQAQYGNIQLPQSQAQIENAYRQQQLAETLGYGNLGLAGRQQTLAEGLGYGNLGISQQQTDLARTLGLGNLGISQQAQDLSRELGVGQLGISQQGADTARLAQYIQGYLGQGNLALGQQQLAATIEQANKDAQFKRAQMAAQLQGPRNAFAQQRYLSGLGSNGVSNNVNSLMSTGAPVARVQGAKAPVEAATLGTFQQDTGLTVPSGV